MKIQPSRFAVRLAAVFMGSVSVVSLAFLILAVSGLSIAGFARIDRPEGNVWLILALMFLLAAGVLGFFLWVSIGAWRLIPKDIGRLAGIYLFMGLAPMILMALSASARSDFVALGGIGMLMRFIDCVALTMIGVLVHWQRPLFGRNFPKAVEFTV